MANEQMTKGCLIALVGEQPAPNLLPLRFLKPSDVVFVCTQRTKQVADNLASLTQKVRAHFCAVHPYRVEEIRQALSAFVSERHWDAPALVFNVTGGTKPMALAAFGLAQEMRARVIYFQTEGNLSLIYHYAFVPNGALTLMKEEQVPETITLDDHLRMYLGTYQEEGVREDFERAVFETLQSAHAHGISEVKAGIRPVGALEIDVVVRCGNQVGIAEVKSKGGKRGIDQLNAAADQRYLGTYVKKFLLAARPVDGNNKELARAYNITVVELPSGASGHLSESDQETLVNTVLAALGGRR